MKSRARVLGLALAIGVLGVALAWQDLLLLTLRYGPPGAQLRSLQSCDAEEPRVFQALVEVAAEAQDEALLEALSERLNPLLSSGEATAQIVRALAGCGPAGRERLSAILRDIWVELLTYDPEALTPVRATPDDAGLAILYRPEHGIFDPSASSPEERGRGQLLPALPELRVARNASSEPSVRWRLNEIIWVAARLEPATPWDAELRKPLREDADPRPRARWRCEVAQPRDDATQWLDPEAVEASLADTLTDPRVDAELRAWSASLLVCSSESGLARFLDLLAAQPGSWVLPEVSRGELDEPPAAVRDVPERTLAWRRQLARYDALLATRAAELWASPPRVDDAVTRLPLAFLGCALRDLRQRPIEAQDRSRILELLDGALRAIAADPLAARGQELVLYALAVACIADGAVDLALRGWPLLRMIGYDLPEDEALARLNEQFSDLSRWSGVLTIAASCQRRGRAIPDEVALWLELGPPQGLRLVELEATCRIVVDLALPLETYEAPIRAAFNGADASSHGILLRSRALLRESRRGALRSFAQTLSVPQAP